MRGRTKRRTDGQRDGDGPTDGQRDRRKDGRTDQQTDEWTRRRRTDGRMETNRRLNGETNRWGEGRDGRTDPATDQSRTGRTDGRMDGQNPPPPFTLGVQQLAEPQVLLGRVEGALQVVGGVGFGQLLEVHEIRPAGGGKRPPRTQIRRVSPQKSPPPPPPKFPHPNPHNPPVFVDEGVEGQAVPPTGGEVLDVHLRVPEAGIGIWGGGQQTTPINMGPGGGCWFLGGGLTPLFSSGTKAAEHPWPSASRGCPPS